MQRVTNREVMRLLSIMKNDPPKSPIIVVIEEKLTALRSSSTASRVEKTNTGSLDVLVEVKAATVEGTVRRNNTSRISKRR